MTPQTTRLFVVCSVVLNVLLGGIVLGDFTQRLGTPSWMSQALWNPPALPAEKHELYEETMRNLAKESKEARSEVREARQKMFALLATEPFDEAAYDAQFEAVHALSKTQRKRMADGLKALALKLTPEERLALAESMKRMPRETCNREEKRDDSATKK